MSRLEATLPLKVCWCTWFRVEGLGLSVQRLAFEIEGSGSGSRSLKSRGLDSRLKGSGLGSRS